MTRPSLLRSRESTNESTAPLGLKAQAGTRFRRPAVPAAPTPAGTIGRRALAMKERASAGCHSHHNDDVGVSDLATSAREKELRYPRDRLSDKAVLAGCGVLAVILVTEQIGGLPCTPAAEIKPRLESPGRGDSSIGSAEAGVTASLAEQPAP